MAKNEPAVTTISEKGQVVIPQSVRKNLNIKPKTKFLVYGEGDTVILKKIELPDLREEWRKLRALVDERIARYGEMTEEEINAIVQEHRHEKKKGA